MDPTTQQNQEEKDIPPEDENSNTESIKQLEEETEEVNENVDAWDDEIFSDSLDSVDSLNTIDFEETGYVMKPDPYVEEPDDDCSLSSESIESSPNAYKDEQHWNGYKVKKRRKKSPLKDVTDNDTVTISSSSDDNETVN